MSDVGLYEAMSTLRAVRRLREDPIPNDVLRRVLEAATWAPSGGNAQPWRIVVVEERGKKEMLGRLYLEEWRKFAVGYDELLEGPPSEGQAKLRRTLGAANHLAESYHLAPAILIFCFNPAQMAITDAELDRTPVVGGASIYPAVQNCLLACRAEGLGCTLTTLLCFREHEVKQLLAIPEGWYTAAAVPIGYPASRGHGPISRRPVDKMAFRDTWDEPFA